MHERHEINSRSVNDCERRNDSPQAVSLLIKASVRPERQTSISGEMTPRETTTERRQWHGDMPKITPHHQNTSGRPAAETAIKAPNCAAVNEGQRATGHHT